jgi:hypothetical protein
MQYPSDHPLAGKELYVDVYIIVSTASKRSKPKGVPRDLLSIGSENRA